MDVLINVVGQRLRLPADSRRFVSGTKEFVKFIFNFDSSWSDIPVYAKFKQNGISKDVELVQGRYVFLPDTLSAGLCTLSLYGISGSKSAKTESVVIKIVDDNGNVENPSGSNPSGGSGGGSSCEFATIEEVKSYLGI